ncbi:hypothetical protein BAE44_0007954 [Dichanthelium oligosanthes]|uniref:Lactation elevated protein 1 n=1 Tax=Dichanthelium oligosanthes TaxID=888268 RepID=A0A1E5W114_9POAL|nr:hypothetical protein BAE44_0007954 [Dichanthelium oligosanthes]
MPASPADPSAPPPPSAAPRHAPCLPRASSVASTTRRETAPPRSRAADQRFASNFGFSYSRVLSEGPLTLYRNLVSQGNLTHDSYQENVASELDNLLRRLQHYEMEMEDYHAKLYIWENSREKERRRLLVEEAEDKQRDGVWIDEKRGFLDKLVMRRRRGNIEPGVGKWVSYLNREKKLDKMVGQKPVAPVAPKGLYLYGNVGSGKTMLMDMFYGATEGVIKHRRRFHFHEAMLEIHDHMHDVWKRRDDDKSVESSAFSWISSLPFDAKIKEWLIGEEKYKQETQQKHILLAVADKFLVDRQANKTGASILCFDEIQDGMQRDIFLELLSKLDENCNKILVGTEKDYRRLIPTEGSTQARRFITLIDELYNHHCRLVCLATSSIDDLFQGTEEGPLFDLESFQFETDTEGTKLRRDVLAEGNVGLRPSTSGLVAILSGQEEMFAFRRAVSYEPPFTSISRLIEMQTPLYLERVQHVHLFFRLQGPAVTSSNRTRVSQSAPSV